MQDAHWKSRAGKALLVCAYGEEEIFGIMKFDGAISLEAFKSRLPSLSKDQEVVFYCI
jgi:hypothetical protein